MSQSEFTPIYNKITSDMKKTSDDVKSFKYNIYNEIYTSDIIRGIDKVEKYIYNKINSIPKNTVWYSMYLVIRFILITFLNFMVMFLPLLIAIAIVGYFKYSPSWLGKTTRQFFKNIVDPPIELRQPE
jgi:hypothetical protein